MKLFKFILLYIITLGIAGNTFLLYFKLGFPQLSEGMRTFALRSFEPVSIFFILSLILVLTAIAYANKSFTFRKNSLRISIIIIGLVLILTLIRRVTELISHSYFIQGWTNTIGYIAIFVVLVSISKDLFKLYDSLKNK